MNIAENNFDWMEIIDRNIIIGQFVGTRNVGDRDYYVLPQHTIDIFGYGLVDIDKPEGLKYHISYDWIMPVVELIEKEYSVSIIEDECEIIKTGHESWTEIISTNSNKLLAIWDAVFRFIDKKNKSDLRS